MTAIKLSVPGAQTFAVNLIQLFVCPRRLVEQVLQDTTDDLRDQCSSVDQAFSQRCMELIQAKTQLETKLAKVHTETVRQAK